MAEVIRATILEPDVLMDLGDGPMVRGQALEFTKPKIFHHFLDRASVTIKASDSTNGVVVSGQSPVSQGLRPRNHQPEVNWHFSFGQNPNRAVSESFGFEKPVLQAQYFGHRDRDVLNSVMDRQTRAYSPFLKDILERNEAGLARYIPFTGRPMWINVFGLTDKKYGQSNPEEGFVGSAMLFLQAMDTFEQPDDRIKRTPMFKFSIATKAANDELIRVRGGAWSNRLLVDSETPWETHLRGMAQSSLIFARMAEGGEGYEWVTDLGIPLKMVDTANSWMKRGENDWFRGQSANDLQFNYGINWFDMLEGLSQSEVEQEAARIDQSIADARKMFSLPS